MEKQNLKIIVSLELFFMVIVWLFSLPHQHPSLDEDLHFILRVIDNFDGSFGSILIIVLWLCHEMICHISKQNLTLVYIEEAKTVCKYELSVQRHVIILCCVSICIFFSVSFKNIDLKCIVYEPLMPNCVKTCGIMKSVAK